MSRPVMQERMTLKVRGGRWQRQLDDELLDMT